MIVAGTVTKKMAPQVVRLYNQMPEPKYVIAMGACAISGGPFKQGYNVLKGIDRYIPVDVHIPGCPPRPEALLHAFMTLQQQNRRAETDRRRQRPRHSASRIAERISGAGIWRARSGAAGAIRQLFGSRRHGRARTNECESLEQIKARIEAAVPGAKIEIIPNPSPAEPAFALARQRACASRSRDFCATIRRCSLDYCFERDRRRLARSRP